MTTTTNVPRPRQVLDVVLVVSHTHWDREWYRTHGEFRLRLVPLVDELLDKEIRAPFLLDGQGVILDDYLAVRPERAAELGSALRSGLLAAGPWLVLADELIPSGEGLIRNLLYGRRVLTRLRAAVPGVLYSPDAFGHAASIPTLAAGFGFPIVILWRGYGGPRSPNGDTARWSAPSGAEVLLVHLPPDGYEFGSSLPADEGAGRERWQRIRDTLSARTSLGCALLTNGADHHAPQHRADVAISLLQQLGRAEDPPIDIRAVSVGAAADEWIRRASARALPTVRGELRDSYGYTWSLQGTFGSRAYQKRANARLERLLVRDVEPWVALAAHRALGSRAPLVDEAWRTLLLCHPHDSLCGCSIDAVAQAVDQRMADVAPTGALLRDDTLRVLVGHDADSACARVDEWQPALVVRNRAPRPRKGVAEVHVDVPVAVVPVGPGSATGMPSASGSHLPQFANFPRLQSLRVERVFVREEAPRHYPRNILVDRHHALAWIPDVPAYGIRIARVGAKRKAIQERIVAKGKSLTNGRITVGFESGALTVQANDRHLRAFIGFETEGDRGDLYTPSLIPETQRVATVVSARVTMRGPLRGEITTLWRVTVAPREVTEAAGTTYRAKEVVLTIVARLQLDAGAEFVRVIVEGENRATDHRLRVVFRTDVTDGRVTADAAFGPVDRLPLHVPAADQAAETVPLTQPLHRWITLFSASSGATLVSDGLAEAEVRSNGEVLVTLVRAVGDLSRNSLLERPGHAGWPAATPLAQCLGPFEAQFGLLLHGPRTADVIARTETATEDILLPLTGETWLSAIDPPASVEGVTLEGEGLAFAAMCESEDRAHVVLRCVNLLDDTVEGRWRLPGISEAYLARLDQTPLGALEVQDGAVSFWAPPRGVITVLVR